MYEQAVTFKYNAKILDFCQSQYTFNKTATSPKDNPWAQKLNLPGLLQPLNPAGCGQVVFRP